MISLKCKKCGNEDRENFYVDFRLGIKISEDYLYVKCRFCNYSWDQEPLDNKKP